MSLSEQILKAIQALSEDEQWQVLLFVEFLQYQHQRQQASLADSEFTQAAQEVMQERRDAYHELA